jgi:hypothetical protein
MEGFCNRSDELSSGEWLGGWVGQLDGNACNGFRFLPDSALTQVQVHTSAGRMSCADGAE